MEKSFCETQGRHSSRGAPRREIARRSAELTLVVDKCVYGVGRNVMGVGRLGRGARSWDLRAFPLVMMQKWEKWKLWYCERGYKRKSSRSGWRGVPSYKRARVHNNSKSEDLLLKRKVSINASTIRVIRSKNKFEIFIEKLSYSYNKWTILIHTGEWECRWHIGLDQVLTLLNQPQWSRETLDLSPHHCIFPPLQFTPLLIILFFFYSIRLFYTNCNSMGGQFLLLPTTAFLSPTAPLYLLFSSSSMNSASNSPLSLTSWSGLEKSYKLVRYIM